MKRGRKPVIVILALFALPVIAQSRREAISGQARACPLGADKRSGSQYRVDAIRIIKDPAMHRFWLWERDCNHPAAPASLAPLPTESPCAFLGAQERDKCTQLKSQGRSVPVIRAGDSLILSEHTSVSDSQLEAVALTTAGAGEAMTVRLKIGSRVLHAL